MIRVHLPDTDGIALAGLFERVAPPSAASLRAEDTRANEE
jgi:hypothetical protein